MRKRNRNIIDQTGRRFGKLVIVSLAERRQDRNHLWMCKCDCGSVKPVLYKNLLTGNTTSCGCAFKNMMKARNTVHGLSITHKKEYRTWKDMKARCLNPRSTNWDDYGGRGISVCDRWVHGDDVMSAPECFVSDMGMCPSGMSLDRIDVNKGYSPENCRWATAKEQASNKRTTRLIEYMGELATLTEWCRRFGAERSRVKYRLSVGMSFEDAMSDNDYRAKSKHT